MRLDNVSLASDRRLFVRPNRLADLPHQRFNCAVVRDNVFWLVPAGRSRIVVAASAPRGAQITELAGQVSPTITLGACP